MGRKRISNTNFTFRADADDKEWYPTYCLTQGTNASEVLRQYIKELRRKALSQRRKNERLNDG